jgi:hypothetical protein
VGVGTPKSRDEMGEGGDDFYGAQRGRCADLHLLGGGGPMPEDSARCWIFGEIDSGV